MSGCYAVYSTVAYTQKTIVSQGQKKRKDDTMLEGLDLCTDRVVCVTPGPFSSFTPLLACGAIISLFSNLT